MRGKVVDGISHDLDRCGGGPSSLEHNNQNQHTCDAWMDGFTMPLWHESWASTPHLRRSRALSF